MSILHWGGEAQDEACSSQRRFGRFALCSEDIALFYFVARWFRLQWDKLDQAANGTVF